MYFSLILITKWSVCQEKAAVSFCRPYKFETWPQPSKWLLDSQVSTLGRIRRWLPQNYNIPRGTSATGSRLMISVRTVPLVRPIGRNRAMDLQHYHETQVKPGVLTWKLPGSCVLPVNDESWELKLWNWILPTMPTYTLLAQNLNLLTYSRDFQAYWISTGSTKSEVTNQIPCGISGHSFFTLVAAFEAILPIICFTC